MTTTPKDLADAPEMPEPHAYRLDGCGSDCGPWYEIIPAEEMGWRNKEAWAKLYSADQLAARDQQWQAKLDALKANGPTVERGSHGNGNPWMGTMREAWEDALQAARVEAGIRQEFQDEVAKLKAENEALLDKLCRMGHEQRK